MGDGNCNLSLPYPGQWPPSGTLLHASGPVGIVSGLRLLSSVTTGPRVVSKPGSSYQVSSAEGGKSGDREALPAPLTPVDIGVPQAALEGFQTHVGGGRSNDSLLGRQASREDQLEPITS